MLTGYILLVLLFIFLYILDAIYRAIFKHQEVDYKVYYVSIITAIIIPIFVFAYIVPNIIIDGYHKEYTNIISSSGITYTVMVEFYIYENEYSHYDGDNEYISYAILYSPRTIFWSNGGQSYDDYHDDGGEVGDMVDFVDQEGHEYEVLIPKMNFTYKEQLKKLSLFDKSFYLLIFSTSITIISLKNKQNHTV